MPRKKNVEQPELKFVRMKNTLDDIVGYVTYGTEYITINQPLRIDIETLFDEGRQILSMQEYLPQSVIEIKEVDINLNDVMFITPVRKDFYEQYEYVSEFFYNNQSKIKPPPSSITSEEISEKTQKVVSILEAMANKKDKPVH
jgi:hypothetical protein